MYRQMDGQKSQNDCSILHFTARITVYLLEKFGTSNFLVPFCYFLAGVVRSVRYKWSGLHVRVALDASKYSAK